MNSRGPQTSRNSSSDCTPSPRTQDRWKHGSGTKRWGEDSPVWETRAGTSCAPSRAPWQEAESTVQAFLSRTLSHRLTSKPCHSCVRACVRSPSKDWCGCMCPAHRLSTMIVQQKPSEVAVTHHRAHATHTGVKVVWLTFTQGRTARSG